MYLLLIVLSFFVFTETLFLSHRHLHIYGNPLRATAITGYRLIIALVQQFHHNDTGHTKLAGIA